MRLLFLPLSLVCLLSACDRPPASAYLGGAPGAAQVAAGTALGNDANGASCTELAAGAAGVFDIYCAGWQLPAARVRDAGAGQPAGLMAAATDGAWREEIDRRFACAEPVASTILGDVPAVALQCRRRIGGWPQVALLAAAGGHVYLADGILPTVPVMQRAIGVLSGRLRAGTATLPPAALDTLLANQLAARAFGAGDVAEYERLMALGARSNLAENFAAAETAYRAALVVQQKALGRDNPDTVNALMHLALQLSDQGRFSKAAPLFAQADAIAPRASDPAAPARLLHYRALHELNQGHTEQALALLERAGAAYTRLLPPESLHAAATGSAAPLQLATADSASGDLDNLPSGSLMIDPTAQSAMMGLIETWRYRAIALRRLGRAADSTAAIASANDLAAANRMLVPLVTARLTRTAATIASANGDVGLAENGLAASHQDFTAILPQTRPVAETILLQAAEYVRTGETGRALGSCRDAVALLVELRSGTDPTLLEPCLAAFAGAAANDAGARQHLLGEMFATAELAQGSVTSRQIAEAAARLAAGSRDPRVAAAIRRRQDAQQTLSDLYQQRDALAQRAATGAAPTAVGAANPAQLDKDIAAAQSELADADAALQAAAPNYGQLVQQVVPASDVLAALGPDEAFAAVTLTGHGGWTFLLRNGQIAVAPVKGDEATVSGLVDRIRASIEPTGAGLPPFDIPDARALYDATLGGVAAPLSGAKALVVAPTGRLLALPFAVLLTGPADAANLAAAPWLIRQMTIAHVPSAANFVALRKAGGSQAARPWFGMGGFHPVTLAQAEATFPAATCRDSAQLFAALPPLPFASRELDAARQILGGSPGDELLNAAFTADGVLHANLRDYRVLHFATHALLPAELRCQDEPAIVTSAPPHARSASGALLTTSQVVGLNLNADLIILSACNSGGPGGATGGESLSGLARAFFYAGARGLLVTHWSVNDQATAFLVADTLNHWKAAPTGGIASALRLAQLDMMDAAGKQMPAVVADPFYWAPFALIGDAGGRATQRTAMR